jgi:hypothetical protein
MDVFRSSEPVTKTQKTPRHSIPPHLTGIVVTRQNEITVQTVRMHAVPGPARDPAHREEQEIAVLRSTQGRMGPIRSYVLHPYQW